MRLASSQPNGRQSADGKDLEQYEQRILARAYRALLANEDFEELLFDVADTARSYTNCEEVVIGAVGADAPADTTTGPWTSGTFSGAVSDPLLRSSLAMPIVSDGFARHVMTLHKSDGRERFSPTEVDHARRCSDIAGLVISGAAIVGAFGRFTGIDDETGVLVRKEFEDDVLAALSANDGRAGLFITRITDLEQINTRWGRDVGDEVLRVVARTMQDAIGGAGTVGRLRRHEFGGLLPGLDYARTAEFAAATMQSLTNPLPVLGRADVSASIVVGAAAAQGGRPNSVIPLFHATYKMLEAATSERPRDPHTRTFGL
jgi:diguanylate cyclase (GGDEF)-like protein